METLNISKTSEYGEYISTEIPCLYVPNEVNPTTGGVSRSVNLSLIRDSGWHYTNDKMVFIPSLNVSGSVISYSIKFTGGKFKLELTSTILNNGINLLHLLKLIYPDLTTASFIGMVRPCDYSAIKNIDIPAVVDISSMIKSSTTLDTKTIIYRIQKLFTTQSIINLRRFKQLVSLKNFINATIMEDVDTFNETIYSGSILTDREAFLIEHSNISYVKLKVDNKIFDVTLLSNLYPVLSVQLNDEEIEEQLTIEKIEESSILIRGHEYNVIPPNHNDIQVYTILINRLLIFQKIGILFDEDQMKNQRIMSFSDTINSFKSDDKMTLENLFENTPSYLVALSKYKTEPDRVVDYLKKNASVVVNLFNNENPYAMYAGSGVSKLVKPVDRTSEKSRHVRFETAGFLDTVDVSEKESISKVTPLTALTSFKDNSLTTSLYKVLDGVLSEDIETIDIIKIYDCKVAEYGADLSKPVLVKYRDEYITVPVKEVEYMWASPFASTSGNRGTAVFANHSPAKRAQLAAKVAEQARAILVTQRNLIETGIESIIANNSVLPFYGTIKDVIQSFCIKENLPIPELDDMLFTVNIIKNSFKEVLLKIDSTDKSFSISPTIILNEKTNYKSSNSNELIYKDFYEPTDVLWKNKQISISSVKALNTDDLKFHSKGDQTYFDKAVNVGRNVYTMIGFYNGYTVDDSAVVSDKLVREGYFITPVIMTYVVDLKAKEDSKEFFGIKDSKYDKTTHTEDGIPLIGTHIYKGDILVYKYSENIVTNRVKITSEESLYTGTIISVERTNNKCTIQIYSYKNISVGDKFSGRHGNKFTISAVVKEEDMPYDETHNRRFELVLNPISNVSRMNLSLFLELYKSTQINDGEVLIVPPNTPVFEEYLSESEDYPLSYCKAIDSVTGAIMSPKAFCGMMYLIRSVHLASLKIRSVGVSDELDPAFLNPVGTGPRKLKGQSVDAMMYDILASLDCANIIQENKGILSSSVEERKKVIEKIKSYELDETNIELSNTNLQLDHFSCITRSIYIYTEEIYDDNGEEYYQIFLNDDLIKNSMQKLPLLSASSAILSPINSNNFTYIELPYPIVTNIAIEKFNCTQIIPIYLDKSPGFEKVTLTNKYAVDIISTTFSVEFIEGEERKIYVYRKPVGNSDRESGMSAIIKILKFFSIDEIEEILLSRLKSKYSKVNDIMFRVRAIRNTGGLEQFITTCVPIMPYKYRASTGPNAKHDVTLQYLSLISLVNNSSSYSDVTATAIYKKIKEVLSSDSPKLKSVSSHFFKKDENGLLRNKMIKNRVTFSTRANICPSQLSNPNKVEIPICACIYLYQPYVIAGIKEEYGFIPDKDDHSVSVLIENILTGSLFRARKLTNNEISTEQDYIKFVNKIKSIVTGRLTYYNRAPTLQETSVIGAEVEVTMDNVEKIPTLVTPDQNADFDGDQENAFAVLSKDANEDIRTKLLPSTRLLRSNDSKPFLKITQDALLGLYMGTEKEASETSINYPSIDAVKESFRLGFLTMNHTVSTLVDNVFMTDTVGKLLVKNCLKDFNLDINFPITDSSIDKITLDIIKTDLRVKDEDTIKVKTIGKLQRLGYELVTFSGVTLGLQDFKPVLDLDSAKETFEPILNQIDFMRTHGLAQDSELNDLLTLKIAEKNKESNIMERLGDNNNLVRIIKSGAKGSTAQLYRMFCSIGSVASPNGLKKVILTNYIRGVSQYEGDIMAYEQRIDAVSTVQGTKDPGIASRGAAFELSSLFVKEDTRKPPRFKHIETYSMIKYESYTCYDNNNLEVTPDKLIYFSIPLTTKIISTLANSYKNKVTVDNGYIIFNKEMDEEYSEIVRKCQYPKDPKTFINMFEPVSGIPYDYLIDCGSERVGQIIGTKSSTALSQPTAQMVISKRNRVGSDSSVDSTFELIRNATLLAKLTREYAYLAPEDGVISIDRKRGCISLSGKYFIYDKNKFKGYKIMVENNQPVTESQLIIRPYEYGPECINPDSYVWSECIVDGISYKDLLVSPNNRVVQHMRYLYYCYMLDLYRSSKIDLSIKHFASLVLQQLRSGVNLDYINDLNLYLDIAQVIETDIPYSFRLMNGFKTILSTGGCIASYSFRDAFASVSNSFINGPSKLNSYIDKMLLGQKIDTTSIDLLYNDKFKIKTLPEYKKANREEESINVPKFIETSESIFVSDDGDSDLSDILLGDIDNDDLLMDIFFSDDSDKEKEKKKEDDELEALFNTSEEFTK